MSSCYTLGSLLITQYVLTRVNFNQLHFTDEERDTEKVSPSSTGIALVGESEGQMSLTMIYMNNQTNVRHINLLLEVGER